MKEARGRKSQSDWPIDIEAPTGETKAQRLKPEAAKVPPPPSQPPVDPTTAEAIIEGQAKNLKNGAVAAYLYTSLSKTFGTATAIPSYQRYIERFLDDCGKPADPLERLLIENVLLAFHGAGHFDVKAACAADAEAAVAYSGAAARLRAEVRRTTVAVAEYRAAAASKAASEARGAKRRKAAKQRTAKPTNGAVEQNDHDSRVSSMPTVEMFPWIQRRFAFAIPAVSPQDAAIASCEAN